jgi:hypothetical protein
MAEPSFLDDLTISDEVVKGPYFGILYGPAGVGKTWLCKHAEKPFFIACEKGVEKVGGVGKFLDKDGSVYLPKTSDEFFKMIGSLCKKGHEYKTIVIDSGMFVDKLFVEQVIREYPTETIRKQEVEVKSISDYTFGKGYQRVVSIWESRFFAAIHALHKRAINVILIAHSKDKTVRDLSGDEFKKNAIDMLEFGRASVPNLLSAKADWVLFMRSEIKTNKKLSQFGEIKNHADNDIPPDIVVYTRGSSGYDAKVRTEFISNVKDQYIIDITDYSTSKQLFTDLEK